MNFLKKTRKDRFQSKKIPEIKREYRITHHRADDPTSLSNTGYLDVTREFSSDDVAIKYAQGHARKLVEDGLSGRIAIVGLGLATGWGANIQLSDIENPETFGEAIADSRG